MGKKKRHHYIPRFYLNGFIDPDNEPYIWVYQKGEEQIIKSTATDIALEKHFYTFTTSEGSKDSETFENMLSEIEGQAAAVFNKIKKYEVLNEEDRVALSIFLAFMLTRVPHFRDNVVKTSVDFFKRLNQMMASNDELFRKYIKTVEEDTGSKMDVPVEELQKVFKEGEYNIIPPPEFSLQQVNAEFAPIFYDMTWLFLKATESYNFLSCDNPLVYFDPTHDRRSPYGVGLLNKNIEVTFPITKDIAFHGTWQKDRKINYLQSNNEMIKIINRRTVMSAARFVYCSKKSRVIQEFIQKRKNTSGARTVIR